MITIKRGRKIICSGSTFSNIGTKIPNYLYSRLEYKKKINAILSFIIKYLCTVTETNFFWFKPIISFSLGILQPVSDFPITSIVDFFFPLIPTALCEKEQWSAPFSAHRMPLLWPLGLCLPWYVLTPPIHFSLQFISSMLP